MVTEKCFVHYPHIEVSAHIVPLDQHKLETLLTAKEAQRNPGGDNAHPEQCPSVPVSTEKKRNVLQDISNQDTERVRISREGSRHVFGDHCMICNVSPKG